MAMRKITNRPRDGRLRLWTGGWLKNRADAPTAPPDATTTIVTAPARTPPLRAVAPGLHGVTRDDLKQQIGTAVIAFRGYDASNIGRGPEFLAHAVYGPILREFLDRAGRVCADVLGRPVDLPARVEARTPASLGSFVEDTATIVAMELAQVRILEEIVGIPVRDAMLSFGHSIGELSALVLGGVYEMEQLLPIPLGLAHDCADLTADTTMGILSSAGGVLEPEQVMRLCSTVSSKGHGMVGPSTFLSPYQVLLLGQADTLDLLEAEMRDFLPSAVTLRRRPNQWPPLHTPLVWERSVPNRAAVALYHTGGGHEKPRPNIVSCTTGRANYDEWNSRAILTEWTDHPQRLWDAIEHTLSSGADLVIHVGPEPKLIPTAFERLSGKVMKQLKSRHLDSLGRHVLPSISRNHWLARRLPHHAVVLRAPFVNHLILEDWLLDQDVA